MTWNQGIERLAQMLSLPSHVAENLFEDAADELEADREPYCTEEIIELVLIRREVAEFNNEYVAAGV